MISRASKCSAAVLLSVADLICDNEDFQQENFPKASVPTEVRKVLVASNDWYIAVADSPLAIFKMRLSTPAARIDQLCFFGTESLTQGVSKLRGELAKARVTHLTVRVPLAEEKGLSDIGFASAHAFARFSRTPEETNMMPILPLANATRKELPELSKLMFEAYSRTPHPLADISAADRELQSIMAGEHGEYVSAASFVSGSSQNLVSACLLVKNSAVDCVIDELFTHPLYRARGLATTEIALAMNHLTSNGFGRVSAWSRDDNAVVGRLLTKMGFNEDRRVREMTIQL